MPVTLRLKHEPRSFITQCCAITATVTLRTRYCYHLFLLLNCCARTHLCCFTSASQRNQWEVTLVVRLTHNWININSSLCPWMTKNPPLFTPVTSSWVNMCWLPGAALFPPVSPGAEGFFVQLGFPPRWIISGLYYSTAARSESAARSSCVPQPQVGPLGASNTSWEFLSVWHSVTRYRDILSSHPLSKENLLWIKGWTGTVPMNENLCLLSTTRSFKTVYSIKLQFHKGMKPSLAARQSPPPPMSKSCVWLRYPWQGMTPSFYNLLLCNNHYRENTGYAIPGWDMTCDKVPQVEIWHTLAERTQNAAKTMTVLKGSFTFHSHTIIFTGWKPSKIFFFFFLWYALFLFFFLSDSKTLWLTLILRLSHSFWRTT